jgi:hypothetical protein
MVGLLGLQLYSQKTVVTSPSLNFQYLTSLAACFGTQMWHMFISKPALLRLLPRHQFGHVESYLMPKYLFVTTLFSGLTAFRFIQRYPITGWNEDMFYTVRFLLRGLVKGFTFVFVFLKGMLCFGIVYFESFKFNNIWNAKY